MNERLLNTLVVLVLMLLVMNIGIVYGALKARNITVREIDSTIALAEGVKDEKITIHSGGDTHRHLR